MFHHISMNNSAGNPPAMSSAVWSATRVPMRNAPTNATIPMLTGRTVAITNIATSARIESSSGDTTHLLGAGPGDIVAGCPISKLIDNIHRESAQRVPSRPDPSRPSDKRDGDAASAGHAAAAGDTGVASTDVAAVAV